MLEVFAVIGLIIFPFVMIMQRGTDERLTEENKERASHRDSLVYYDHLSKCYRSTKTKQKAARYVAQDKNGELYEYVVTVPFYSTVDRGKLIEARYLDVRKRNDPVLLNDWHFN